MDNYDLKYYPHSCTYLSYLWNVELLSGSDILARSLEMQDWLDTNCYRDTFRWSDTYSKFPLDYNKGSNIRTYSVQQIALADRVYFKYGQDLLAFRLRWGIQDTISLL